MKGYKAFGIIAQAFGVVMKHLFKRVAAVIFALSLAVVFTSCMSKDTYNPNYVLHTSPFGDNEPQQSTQPISEPAQENLGNDNANGAEDYLPDPGADSDYDSGGDTPVNNNSNENSAGDSGNKTNNSSGGGNKAVTTTQKKTPAASPTKKNSGGSSGSSLEGILGSIGGGNDSEILGGAVKTITDMIDAIKNGALNSGSSSSPAPVMVSMNLSQAMDVYNTALAKAYSSKPTLERVASAKVLDYESDNPAWHIAGQLAAKAINDTVKAETEKTPIWPERGSVEESLFRVKLNSNNTRGFYATPQQAGDIIFFDFGVNDPGVQFPLDSKNITTSNIVDVITKGLEGVSGRDITANIKWTRIICAIDRSNDRFVSLQHDFILEITISGSTNWPNPSYFRLMMSQGYENFKY